MNAADRQPTLHVLPADLARGAQVYARQLCDQLGGAEAGHLLVTLFESEPGPARPDHQLAVSRSLALRTGYDVRCAWRLWRLRSTLDAGVVVAHGVEPLKYALPLRLRRGVSVVVYAIGTVHEKARRIPLRQLYGWLLRRADRVLAVSDDVADECETLFRIRPDRLAVVPNGRPVPPLPPPHGDRRPVLAFVGQLTAGKRPELFVEVVRRLNERGMTFDAWMAGSGERADFLAADAAAAGVRLLGSRGDVPSLLATADVFLFTSCPAGEGMPGVLIEAGMAGLATVATDVPGARSVLSDGVTGYVVPVDDITTMTDAVARLLEDPDLRRRMGALARERCVKHFSLTASAERWRAILADYDRAGEVG